MCKRVILLFLYLLLCVSVLCACQGQSEQENLTAETADTTVTEVSDPTEIQKITEAIEVTEVTEVPETTVVMEMTEATEPPAPAEPTSPTEERHPTETTNPQETTAPTEATNPQETTAPTEATNPPEITEPTEVTNPPEITEPTEVTNPLETTTPTEESAMAEWKKAYLEFLEINHFEFSSYRLVYVDGDDIPELYLSGICEAGGDSVCSFKNGEVIQVRLKRKWGGYFIPGSGMILNCNGNMGYYSTDVYNLTESSFVLLLSGLEIQSYDYLENGDLKITSEYFLEDEPVSEEEFYAAIAAVFDYSEASSLYQGEVSYDEIRQQILDY